MNQIDPTTPSRGIGDNSGAAAVEIEVRLFNSLARYMRGSRGNCKLTLPAGSDVGDIMRLFGIPHSEVFLVLRNGRDLTPELEGGVRTEYQPEPGDVIALSGPVPYSWGYGSPVV